MCNKTEHKFPHTKIQNTNIQNKLFYCFQIRIKRTCSPWDYAFVQQEYI